MCAQFGPPDPEVGCRLGRMDQPRSDSFPRTWPATCLVVEPPASNASVDHLIGSLKKRGMIVRRCENAHAAMADLIRHQCGRRSHSSHRGSSEASLDPLVVVMVEPRLLPRSEELYEAGLRHAPRAVFWEFKGHPVERLTAYRPAQGRQVTPLPAEHEPPLVARGVPARKPASESRPALRLAGETDPRPGPLLTETSRCETESSERLPDTFPREHARLTEEELIMLLGEGPEGEIPGEKRE